VPAQPNDHCSVDDKKVMSTDIAEQHSDGWPEPEGNQAQGSGWSGEGSRDQIGGDEEADDDQYERN